MESKLENLAVPVVVLSLSMSGSYMFFPVDLEGVSCLANICHVTVSTRNSIHNSLSLVRWHRMFWVNKDVG